MWRHIVLMISLLVATGCERNALRAKPRLAPLVHQKASHIYGVFDPKDAKLSLEERHRLEGRWRGVLETGWVGVEAMDELATRDLKPTWAVSKTEEPADEQLSSELEPEADDEPSEQELYVEPDVIATDDDPWVYIDDLQRRIDALESRLQALEQQNTILIATTATHRESLAFLQTALAVGIMLPAR